MNKKIIFSIFAATLIIVGALVFTRPPSGISSGNSTSAQSVIAEDGTQIIEVRAHGGYTPEKIVAKAGLPTILKMDGRGSFDCSSSIRIPDLGIAQNLSQTEVIEIKLGTPKAGTLNATCGMGMYRMEIVFEK